VVVTESIECVDIVPPQDTKIQIDKTVDGNIVNDVYAEEKPTILNALKSQEVIEGSSVEHR
jgi:hypothetical protein